MFDVISLCHTTTECIYFNLPPLKINTTNVDMQPCGECLLFFFHTLSLLHILCTLIQKYGDKSVRALIVNV